MLLTVFLIFGKTFWDSGCCYGAFCSGELKVSLYGAQVSLEQKWVIGWVGASSSMVPTSLIYLWVQQRPMDLGA